MISVNAIGNGQGFQMVTEERDKFVKEAHNSWQACSWWYPCWWLCARGTDGVLLQVASHNGLWPGAVLASPPHSAFPGEQS